MVTKLQYVKAINLIEQWHKEHNLSEYIRFYERCVSLLGVDKTELRSKWRKRELVYARIIITFAINKKFRLIPDHIFAQIMNRDRSTLLYYLNKYEVLSEYEDFSIIKDRLSLILNE
jgi:chromosomal replication initiation ATPase DnaA